MTQSLAQIRTLKTLGKDYTGPRLDRPALRQLPRGWTLEEARPVRRLSPDMWVGIACVLGWIFCVIQTVMEWL